MLERHVSSGYPIIRQLEIRFLEPLRQFFDGGLWSLLSASWVWLRSFIVINRPSDNCQVHGELSRTLKLVGTRPLSVSFDDLSTLVWGIPIIKMARQRYGALRCVLFISN